MPGIIDSKLDTHGTLASLPCALPQSAIPPGCDAQHVVDQFADHLPELREEHLTKDALWRDSFALTGTLRTFYSSSVTILAWRKLCVARQVHGFSSTATPARAVRLPGGSCWVEGTYEFRTAASPAATCTAVVALTPDEHGTWKIWMLGTVLQGLLGLPSPDDLRPDTAAGLHRFDSQASVSDARPTHHQVPQTPLGCVVVGAGQAGLSVGGRLKALGVSYVVLDKNKNIGDSWKLRYDSARLHTTRQWAHLPFDRTFPGTYQEYLTKDDLAAGHEDWVNKYGINVWTSTTLLSGSWDPNSALWTLVVRCGTEERSLVTKSVVLATGPGGQRPCMPSIPNWGIYSGEALHSVNFKSAQPWKGKRGVVVGIANTAHDVAQDMFEAGCSSVTMIQRSTTYIVPAEYYKKILDQSYNDDVPT